MFFEIRTLLVVLTIGVLSGASILAAEEGLYFPPTDGVWESVKPNDAGWDAEKLQKALDYAGKNQSSGVVVLYRGRILAEQYWKPGGDWSALYRARAVERDKVGRAIEDVASAQKSVTSVLVGIAQQKGLLKIEDRVDKYLGEGWSKATPKQESAITIRHLITMTSGLTDRGSFEAPAGTKWRYNTAAYARSMNVIEKAAKMDRHELTKKWLTDPLGMSNSKWAPRGAQLQSINGFGFATTARDLARFGLMMLANGKWDETAILADPDYFKASTTSSQELNPFYGYLWWLNRSTMTPQSGAKRNIRVATAPKDMFSANGALNRRCFVVPSRQLVVTRLGDRPTANKAFDREFWRLLMAAVD